MPAKGKYFPETVDAIVNTIALTGCDADGYTKGGISHDTFYKWINEKPEFAEQVAQAKREYRESSPAVMKRQAKKAFVDYLHGRVQEKWTTYERIEDEDGNVTTKDTTKIVNRGVPQWAIDRVLGKPMDVLDALKVLADAEFIPQSIVEQCAHGMDGVRTIVYQAFAGASAGTGTEPVAGISDETWNLIKQEISGIASQESDTDSTGGDSDAVSGEVAERHEHDQGMGEVTSNWRIVD